MFKPRIKKKADSHIKKNSAKKFTIRIRQNVIIRTDGGNANAYPLNQVFKNKLNNESDSNADPVNKGTA